MATVQYMYRKLAAETHADLSSVRIGESGGKPNARKAFTQRCDRVIGVATLH